MGAGSIVSRNLRIAAWRYRATRLQSADQAELPAWREEHNTSRLRAQEEFPYKARRRGTGRLTLGDSWPRRCSARWCSTGMNRPGRGLAAAAVPAAVVLLSDLTRPTTDMYTIPLPLG